MFHDESWIFIHFGVQRSKVKVTSHKNFAGLGLRTLVSAVCFLFTVVHEQMMLVHVNANNEQLL